jgi:hypothetical protein
MTNYCENLMEIEGGAADLRAFRTACINESGNLDFAAIMPVPDVLRGTHEGIGDKFGGDAELGASALSRTEVSFHPGIRQPILEREAIRKAGIRSFEELEAWLRRRRPKAIELGARCLEAHRQTGHFTERSWKAANWGTHYWEGFVVKEETETRLVAEFATAWSPAVGIYHELARRFPALAITVSAMEPGNELSYRFSSRNGEVTEDEPGLTTEFVEQIEGELSEVDAFYLHRAQLTAEPSTHVRFWFARRRIRRALRGYPTYSPPHEGIEMLLPENHARENFDYFMSQRPARGDALRQFLEPFGVPLEFSDSAKSSLDKWLAKYGAFLWVKERGSSYLTHRPGWDGLRAGLNVIHDVAVFLGEFAIRETPGLHWEMYIDVPTGLQRQQEAFQKPAIAGFSGNPRWRFFPHDRVHMICHALRERTYMGRKPRMSVQPEALYTRFVSETLVKTGEEARRDASSLPASP